MKITNNMALNDKEIITVQSENTLFNVDKTKYMLLCLDTRDSDIRHKWLCENNIEKHFMLERLIIQ